MEEFKPRGLRPLLVYLDSSDFSSMAEHLNTDDLIDLIGQELEQITLTKNIQFVYSGIHISEMAPIEAKYHTESCRRSKQLVRFCGKSSLIPINELFNLELRCLLEKSPPDFNILADNGRWFSESSLRKAFIEKDDIIGSINDALRNEGLKRSERQRLKKKIFRDKNTLEAFLNQLFISGNGENAKSSFLKRFPMTDHSYGQLLAYLCGKGSEEQAVEAFLECVRDPVTLTRWFENHADLLNPIVRLVRDQSERFTQVFTPLIENLNRIIEDAGAVGVDKDLFLGRSHSDARAIEAVERVVSSLLDRQSNYDNHKYSDIEKYCPGITLSIRVAYSSHADSIGGGKRRIKSSDMVDFVHAIYVPYVDVFRADKYMAPHIQKFANNYRTQVVGKLKDLPAEINLVRGLALDVT